MFSPKKYYDSGITFLILTIAFWFMYTIAFQIIDGWHYAPINPMEVKLDGFTRRMLDVSFGAIALSVLFEHHKKMKQEEK